MHPLHHPCALRSAHEPESKNPTLYQPSQHRTPHAVVVAMAALATLVACEPTLQQPATGAVVEESWSPELQPTDRVQVHRFRSARIQMDGIQEVWLSDTEVAYTSPLEASVITGAQVGITTVVVQTDAGEERWDLQVLPSDQEPQPSPYPHIQTDPDATLTLTQGDVEVFACSDRLQSVGITNLSQLEIRGVSADRIAVAALEPGLGELTVTCRDDDRPEFLHVTVH